MERTQKEMACGLKETVRGDVNCPCESGLRLFDQQMRAGIGAGENA
jgi:hypothetical protein